MLFSRLNAALLVLPKYLGPIVLVVASSSMLGAEPTKALYELLAISMLCTTLARFGADNKILKGLDGSDLPGMCYTVLLLAVASPLGLLAIISLVPAYQATTWQTALSIMMVNIAANLATLVAAYSQVRRKVEIAAILDFGSLQAGLACALVLMQSFFPKDNLMDFAMSVVAVVLTAFAAAVAWKEGYPVLKQESVTCKAIVERAWCFAPTAITYLASWGGLFLIASATADEYVELVFALRIGTGIVSLLSLAILISLKFGGTSVDQIEMLSKRVSLLLACAAIFGISLLYKLVEAFELANLPAATNAPVLLMYFAAIVALGLGPATYFANVRGQHLPIGASLLFMLVVLGGLYGAGVDPSWALGIFFIVSRWAPRIAISITRRYLTR